MNSTTTHLLVVLFGIVATVKILESIVDSWLRGKREKRRKREGQ